MTANIPLELSRIAATAETLSGAAEDPHRFISKAVLLTGESQILITENGRTCFMDSIRLLTRMVNSVTVAVPDIPEVFGAAKTLVAELGLRTAVEVMNRVPIDLTRFDAILSVGSESSPELPMTVVNSNGWVARVGSSGKPISPYCGQPNPIGSLAAASLGAGEVFKRLIKLRPARGRLHRELNFSFFAYKAQDDPGPLLVPTQLDNVLLCGVGAIGNAIAHLLNSMEFTGHLRIVDKQEYTAENIGTCVTLASSHIGDQKAQVVARSFKKIRCESYVESIETFIERCGRQFPIPPLVVNGFDNVAARRAVQDLWPDQIIDGAIGATSCEVTLHPWGPDLSCLKCDFVEPETSAIQQQMRATGLPATALSDLTLVLTEEDIQLASAEKLDWLQNQRGKPLCSVVQEAILAMLSSESHQQGFQPSVPFVATLSACMVVAEMYRYLNAIPTPLETGFQFDVMIGPQNGQFKDHGRKADCVCVSRRNNIETIRKIRSVGK